MEKFDPSKENPVNDPERVSVVSGLVAARMEEPTGSNADVEVGLVKVPEFTVNVKFLDKVTPEYVNALSVKDRGPPGETPFRVRSPAGVTETPVTDPLRLYSEIED